MQIWALSGSPARSSPCRRANPETSSCSALSDQGAAHNSHVRKRANMALSQVDPSRLQGDNLRLWYLRSPGDIEQERERSQAERYKAFFEGLRPASNTPISVAAQQRDAPYRPPPGQPHLISVATKASGWGIQPPPKSDFNSKNTWSQEGNQHVAKNDGFCAACHGPHVAPPPPAMANPPDWPRWTPGPNTTPRKPAKPHPRQCAQQNMSDSRICSREPGDAWKSVCFESASAREAHCIASDGEVGWPPLQTHDRR